jgi:hypothetical protein
MIFLLWLLAVILVVYGVVELINGNTLRGVVIMIIGFLVGPGGASIFT